MRDHPRQLDLVTPNCDKGRAVQISLREDDKVHQRPSHVSSLLSASPARCGQAPHRPPGAIGLFQLQYHLPNLPWETALPSPDRGQARPLNGCGVLVPLVMGFTSHLQAEFTELRQSLTL